MAPALAAGSLPLVPPGKPLKAMVAITKETINIKIKYFFKKLGGRVVKVKEGNIFF